MQRDRPEARGRGSHRLLSRAASSSRPSTDSSASGSSRAGEPGPYSRGRWTNGFADLHCARPLGRRGVRPTSSPSTARGRAAVRQAGTPRARACRCMRAPQRAGSHEPGRVYTTAPPSSPGLPVVLDCWDLLGLDGLDADVVLLITTGHPNPPRSPRIGGDGSQLDPPTLIRELTARPGFSRA